MKCRIQGLHFKKHIGLNVKNAQLLMHTTLTNLKILIKAKKALKSSENQEKTKTNLERPKERLKNPQLARKSEKRLRKCIISNE